MSLWVSTRGRYGVRLMVALAQRYGAGVTLMKDVAREEGISEKYLGQIIMPLKSAGLVVSQRGTHGGYSLARPSAEITVRDVIVAIEGPIAPAPCTDRAAGRGKGGATCGCPYPPVCAVSRVWRDLRDDMERSLGRVTLQELARQASEARATAADYVI